MQSFTKMASREPFKIFTCDLLILDRVKPLHYRDKQGNRITNAALQELLDKYEEQGRLKKGGKGPLKREEIAEFEKIFDAEPTEGEGRCQEYPGGSSANACFGVKQMLRSAVDVDFVGVIGNTRRDDLITADFKRSGMRLKRIPGEGESALSYVFNGGDRIIGTYAGNARALIKSKDIKEEDIEGTKECAGCDAVFLQAGLAFKLDNTKYVLNGHARDDDLGVADKMLKLRWKHGKDLWLAMPTQADFAPDQPENSEQKIKYHVARAKYFKNLITSANVILSNGEEIARVYTTEEELRDIERYREMLASKGIKGEKLQNLGKYVGHGITATERMEIELTKRYNLLNKSIAFDEALKRLHADLVKRPLAKLQWGGKNIEQLGFVTLGKEGIAVITADPDPRKGIREIKSIKVNDSDIENTLGCGDSAYAGILAGIIARKRNSSITPLDIATLGREVATLKLYHNGARIPDLVAALHSEKATDEGKGVFAKVERALGLAKAQTWSSTLGGAVREERNFWP